MIEAMRTLNGGSGWDLYGVVMPKEGGTSSWRNVLGGLALTPPRGLKLDQL